MQWAGRFFSLMRVGAHLARLEAEIGAAVGAPAPVLIWEEMLDASRPKQWWKPHPGWNDFGAFGVFATIAVVAIVLGTWRGYHGHEKVVITLAIVQLAVAGTVILTLAATLPAARSRARKTYAAAAAKVARRRRH